MILEEYVAFLILIIKTMARSNLREEKLSLVVQKDTIHYGAEIMATKVGAGGICYVNSQEAENRPEVRPTLRNPLPLAKALLTKVSTTFQNYTTITII